MRSLLRILPLAWVLWTAAAFATKPMPPPSAVQAPALVSAEGKLLYNFSQRPLENVADGDIRVTAENATAAPQYGNGLLRILVENRGNSPEKVTLAFAQRGSGNATIRRTVEVAPGELQRVTLTVPSAIGYGQLTVTARGITDGGSAPIHFTRANEALLVVGTDEGFQSLVQTGPDSSTYGLLVRSVPPSELPTELGALIGFSEVVVLSPLEALSESARRVLEAYVATGGTLVIPDPGRGTAQALPLLTGLDSGLHRYGFGHVRLCSTAEGSCAAAVASDLSLAAIPIRPVSGGAQTYRAYLADGAVPEDEQFLLAQAVAPVGRFMAIILVFTLAIGPGSLWIARKKGPPMLLLTIPGTAAITCLLIVGWSVLIDGFAVHAASRGYTLLDRANNRAVTVGLAAFYANVAPGDVAFDRDTALIRPAWEGSGAQIASTDWTEGQALDSDFIPSRTYREWGVATVAPSRARLVAREDGDAIVVENALGEDIRAAWIRHGGQTWAVRGLGDGRSARANLAAVDLDQIPVSFYGSRFHARVRERATGELQEGEFIAWVSGPGPLPFGGMRLTHTSSEHIIRGEVDR